MKRQQRDRQFASNDELYAFVDSITKGLRAQGFAWDAERLHTLIHKIAWTTSTELFGELRIALRQTREKRALLDDALISDIALAIDALDRGLLVSSSSHIQSIELRQTDE